MENYKDILEDIETENFVWVIYFFIIIFSFVANSFEKKYFLTGNKESKNTYRTINIFIFSVAFIIYLYFFRNSYNSLSKLNNSHSCRKIYFNKLNTIASGTVVIAGAIFLYIALFDYNLDTEIAFN